MSADAATSAIGLPRRRPVSVTVTASSPGANRRHSAAQLPTTLVGATTRKGAATRSRSLAWHMRASAWSVLPSPMSSARIPPSRCS